jgi:hypothetical protein
VNHSVWRHRSRSTGSSGIRCGGYPEFRREQPENEVGEDTEDDEERDVCGIGGGREEIGTGGGWGRDPIVGGSGGGGFLLGGRGGGGFLAGSGGGKDLCGDDGEWYCVGEVGVDL